MERHVVERGVAAKLLVVVNNPVWPPSLREISAGCLEFFQASRRRSRRWRRHGVGRGWSRGCASREVCRSL
jgi:hypothetical protein